MSFHQINTLNKSFVLTLRAFNYLGYFSFFSFVFSRDYKYFIAFFYFCRHYITSGARDTIFINFLLRSSLVTGPKIRVPKGSPFALTKTAALVSNLIALPSLRRISFFVLTITAFKTSPFLTLPLGIASLAEKFNVAPKEALPLLDPPKTFMH